MNQALIVKDDMSLSELGAVFVRSGFFQDARDASQAIVKILAGREMGFGPIASMTGVYIVKGKPSMGANLIAAAIKRSGRYDYRVKVMSDRECTIEFQERIDGKRELIGVSTFTIEDAKKAGTQNIEKFPRNMLFARAMSNGAKWFCPDVFGGPIYTPEELGAAVDGDGEVITSEQGNASSPIIQVTSEHDAELEEQIMSDSPAPVTEPKADVPRKSFRIASVKFNGMSADQWHAVADGFANANPNWQKNGHADMQHILVSAGNAGYEIINGDNIDAVFAAIVAAHEAKQH